MGSSYDCLKALIGKHTVAVVTSSVVGLDSLFFVFLQLIHSRMAGTGRKVGSCQPILPTGS